LTYYLQIEYDRSNLLVSQLNLYYYSSVSSSRNRSGSFSFHIRISSRNWSVSMYWSGGGSSKISDKVTLVNFGFIVTIGASNNIWNCSCFPFLTASII